MINTLIAIVVTFILGVATGVALAWGDWNVVAIGFSLLLSFGIAIMVQKTMVVEE